MPATQQKNAMSRSVLRYRPIDHNITASRSNTLNIPARASRTQTDTIDPQTHAMPSRKTTDKYVTTMPTEFPGGSSISKLKPQKTAWHPFTSSNQRRNLHPLFLISLGMNIAIILVFSGLLVRQWEQSLENTLRYGYPRTFQKDAFVGHESGKTPSHFVATNIHGQIEIIEFPGGEVTHAHIYPGPRFFGSGNDQTPVTLEFISTGDRKHPDMLVSFQDMHVLFLNRKGIFQLASIS